MKRNAVASLIIAACLGGMYLIIRYATESAPAELAEPSPRIRTPNVEAPLEAEAPTDDSLAPAEPVSGTIYISGLVEDSAGRPMPESRVDAKWTTGNQSVLADEDGQFRLPIPRNTFGDGAFVIIRKANYQGRVYDVPFRGKEEDGKLTGYLDSRLGEFPVTGERVGEGEGAFGTWDTVIFYNGENYPGLLTLQESTDGIITGSWEDELGPPELSRLVVPETITLSATLETLRAFPESYDVPHDGRDDITLVMSVTASIEGRVVDSAGVPQSGWQVFALGEQPAESTNTDEAGAFSFTGLAAGRYEVSANAQTSHAATRVKAPNEIFLKPGDHVHGLTLVVGQSLFGQSLSGYITSSDGTPIQNAWIRSWLAEVRLASDGSTSFQTQTDATGRYEVTGIPEQLGILVNMTVGHQNHMQTSRYGVLVDGTEQDFVLVKNPIIEGRVLDAASRAPVTDFRLYSWVGDGFDEEDHLAHAGRRKLESHPDGEFSLQVQGFNQVRIAVSAPGYSTGLHRFSGVQSGETVADVEILLQPTTPLTGTVVSSDGNPVRDARIFLNYPLMVSQGGSVRVGILGSEGVTQTDSQGAFSISEYPESLSVISAYHPDYAPSWTTVTSPTTSIEIVLPQGGKLEGFVTYGGVPLENRRSHININSPNDSSIMQTYTGDDGHYEMEMLPIGPLTISTGFHEGGLRRYIQRDINIQSGQTLRLDFDFGDAYDSYVEGTLLLNDRPAPLSLLRGIVQFENGDRILYQTETASDGAYQLGPIPPAVFEFGAMWILLDDGSYVEPPLETVTTRPGETTHHDIILVMD